MSRITCFAPVQRVGDLLWLVGWLICGLNVPVNNNGHVEPVS